jgi:hypothetical protein
MNSARTFPTRFQGQWLECHSPQDSAAVQRAGDILCDLAPRPTSDEERIDLTLALFRYGRYRAAISLRRRLACA